MKTLEESKHDEKIARPDSPNSVLNEDSCRVNLISSLNASVPGRKVKITRNNQVKITRNRHSIATQKVVDEKSKSNFNSKTRSSICTSTINQTGNLPSFSSASAAASSSPSTSYFTSPSSSSSKNTVKQQNLSAASRSVPTTCFYK